MSESVCYQRMEACVQYHAYEFTLPETLSPDHYAKLRAFIQGLGDVEELVGMQLIRVRAPDFFVDFPAYGFPLFKISFYKHVAGTRISAQLAGIVGFMEEMGV